MEHGALAGLVLLAVVVGFVRLCSDVRSELAEAGGEVDGRAPRAPRAPRGGRARSRRSAGAPPDGDGVLAVGERAARGPAAASGARVPRQGGAGTWS